MRRALHLLVPVAALLPALAGAQYPTTPPQAAPLKPAQFPPFQEATLTNGVHLVVVEKHDQPVISVSLSFPAGAAYDPGGKEGLSDMVAGLLTKGAGNRSAEQIAETIEGVGGSIFAGSGPDFLTIRADALSGNAPLAFELVGDAAARPTFPQKEIDLLRQQTLSGLQLEMSDPAAIASRAFATAVYGKSPYAKRPTPATVQAITRDDLVAFQKSRLSPSGALLVVAGDITLEKAKALATTAFAGWTGNAPTPITIPAPPAHAKTEILLVHRPASVQSDILVGGATFLPTDPRFYALRVANQILGGGPESRLFLIVREQKGFAYDAHTEVNRTRDIGDFRAVTEVRTQATDSALTEVLAQLDRLRAQALPASELDATKGELVGRFPLTIETADQVAQAVTTAKELGLAPDYLQTYRNKVAAVTASDIQNVAKSVIVPNVIVVVGDASKLYDRLQKIAPVTLMNPDGTPLAPSDLMAKAAPIKIDVTKIPTGKDSFDVVLLQGPGQTIGFETSTVAREGENFHMTDNVAIPLAGLVQQQDVVFNAATLTPVHISGQLTAQGQVANTDVTFAGGRAKGSAQSPTPAGMKTTQVDTAVAAGVISSDMFSAIVPALDFADGFKTSFPMFETADGNVVTENVSVLGKESVTVPAGTFDAYRVQAQGKQTVTLLVTVAAPHRLLKIIPTGQPLEFRLVK